MPRNNPVCPHCGTVNLSQAPALAKVAAYARTHKTLTARGLADALDMTMNVVGNSLRRLTDLGVLRRGEATSIEGGGIEYAYHLVEAKAPKRVKARA